MLSRSRYLGVWMTDLCREMEKEPMCGSVRGGNTISIVRPLVVNGTAGEISALSPEEHLRTEHQRFFFIFYFQASARPQCLQTTSATETVQPAEQRAEVMKQNRDESAGRTTHLLNTFSIFPTLLLFLFFSACLFISPRGVPIPLRAYLSVSITTSRRLRPLSLPLLPPLPLSQHTHHDLSLISRERLV